MKKPAKRGTGARKPKPDDPEQSKRFEQTARELDADVTGSAFERAIGAVAPPTKPKKQGN
jgi:hypothetical protein